MDNMEGQFSRDFKDQMIMNRYNDYQQLKIWLGENKIEFKDKCGFEIYVGDIVIYDNMKVGFPKSQKRYQYNLEGIKEKILKEV